MSQPLFRPEVLAERQTQWLGTVLLTPRLSFRLFAAFAVLATTALLSLFFFAGYTRKARIDGWLVPQQGLVQVFAPQPGVVAEIYAKEGAEVHRGDRLLVLSAELESTALGATRSEIVRRLVARRDSLAQERHERERLGAQQLQSLESRLLAVQSELAHLDGQIALQKSRVQLAEKSEARQRELNARGVSSDQQSQQAQEARLEQEAKLRDLERSRIIAERERLTMKGALQDLPIQTQTEIATIERGVAEVEQELAEAEARREIVISAPEDGTVTAIQAERGSRAASDVPLLSIVPAGAQLEAHMFCPSRAVGFLQSGQRVMLRFQAYPYQKFGHYEGVLANISRSAVNPGELPPQLAGLTSLFGSSEPVYRITVNLERQTITAYGQAVALQPGMQVEADVLIERRWLYEWVLDPLYTLTGKWQG